MKIFIHPRSAGGSVWTKWKKAAPYLSKTEFELIDISTRPLESLTLEADETLVAAGGDGSLHELVNGLIRWKGLDGLAHYRVGHLGLGSNNSYLQPAREVSVFGGFPARIGPESKLQDIGEVEYADEVTGKILKRYFVANASLGLLAEANVKYNQAPSVQLLKRAAQGLADEAAFFLAWKDLQPVELKLTRGGDAPQVETLTNLHLIKRPYFAGGFRVLDPPLPDDGKLGVYGLPWTSRANVLKRFLKMATLEDFSSAYRWKMEADVLRLESSRKIPLEMDGEVIWGRDFTVRCRQKKMRACL